MNIRKKVALCLGLEDEITRMGQHWQNISREN